jgi:NAD(P)-dependent dehydrogenase (short-subunit alcohol dehydrogenase family)
VATVVARFGTVDILVNNAIATKIVPIAEVDDEGRVINLRSGSEGQGLRGTPPASRPRRRSPAAPPWQREREG